MCSCVVIKPNTSWNRISYYYSTRVVLTRMRIDCKLGSHTRRGGCKDRAVAPDLGLSLLARGR
jgi:hypothetical protein